MRMYDIIKKKRDGGVLSRDEIAFAIDGYTKGDIPDYQMSALAMAIYFNGMTDDETTVLTECMMNSGDVVDLSRFGTKSADKHSTGGVGDKTSLIVLPVVAANGGIFAKMSGRGLGHTGGTVDKLESIDGYRTELSAEEFAAQVERVGLALVGQSGNLTPADKKLYALRDVTATVDSIPLIASSIMSKKLASGAHNIVLDVKCGSGAFMKTKEDAEALAELMEKIGDGLNRNVRAVVTDMDTPLGHNIGNALEVTEAIEVLKGGGPDDLRGVALTLCAHLISMINGVDYDTAYDMAENSIADGSAYDKLCEWVSAQGGDIERIAPLSPSYDVVAHCDGVIEKMDAEKVGLLACVLGAGREKKGDAIDYGAGIVLHKKTGDQIKKGDVVATLYTKKQKDFTKQFFDCIKIKQVG